MSGGFKSDDAHNMIGELLGQAVAITPFKPPFPSARRHPPGKIRGVTLHQDRYWVDINGNEIPLVDIDMRYANNIVHFLVRRADHIAWMEACSFPDDDWGGNFDAVIDEMATDPVKWLLNTKLLLALRAKLDVDHEYGIKPEPWRSKHRVVIERTVNSALSEADCSCGWTAFGKTRSVTRKANKHQKDHDEHKLED